MGARAQRAILELQESHKTPFVNFKEPGASQPVFLLSLPLSFLLSCDEPLLSQGLPVGCITAWDSRGRVGMTESFWNLDPGNSDLRPRMHWPFTSIDPILPDFQRWTSDLWEKISFYVLRAPWNGGLV